MRKIIKNFLKINEKLVGWTKLSWRSTTSRFGLTISDVTGDDAIRDKRKVKSGEIYGIGKRANDAVVMVTNW